MSDILQYAEDLYRKDLSFEEWYDLSRLAWPDMVAEIKRLREEMRRLLRAIAEHEDNATISHQQLAAKDARIQELKEFIKVQSEQFVAGNKQTAELLARWQQIAIDERARIILDAEDKFERAKIHHCPNTSESCQDDCDLSWCPSAEFWRSVATKELGQAAKELDLEQEASYVTRLEEKILDFYECDATRRGCCRQVAQDQARAALVRIREGKE